MSFWSNPFFWALVSMFGLVAACTIVGSRRVGRFAGLGFIIVTVFFLGRVLLVLPFCDQPRFYFGEWQYLVGGVLVVVGLVFGLGPTLFIRALNVAEERMDLRTSGFYGIVRNPIYLGELFWCLGWAMVHGSIIGVALVPLWWIGLLLLVFIEEESLERALGQAFLEYRKQVRGRIIPGLPI